MPTKAAVPVDELGDLLDRLRSVATELDLKVDGDGEEDEQKTDGEGGGADAFMEIKSRMAQRLRQVKESKKSAEESRSMAPQEQVKMRSENRQLLRKAKEDLDQLKAIHRKEQSAKRKNRRPHDEIVQRQEIVRYMEGQLWQANEALTGISGGGPPGASINMPLPRPGGRGRRHGGMSSQQAQLLSDAHQRTEVQDQKIEQIGSVVNEINEVAVAMGEELQRQAHQLEDVNKEIEGAHEHLASVNAKMKKQLLAVGRPVDKLCMDVVCLAILLGLAAVVYNMTKGGGGGDEG
eukprot:g4817.t1